jgi:imidazolonepropionase-like amidohydrolase
VSAQQSAIPAASLVFDGVTVVDVEQGKLLPDQRVTIAGNRIAAVGSASTVKIPKDAQVVNARGKYLIPGLWDLHSHYGSKNAQEVDLLLLLANGVTAIREAYAFVPLETQVEWWKEVMAGTRVGPPRQLLTGQRPATTYEDMVSRKERGANFLKIYPFSYEKAAAAKRAGLPFGGHVHGGTAIEASDSGMTILDHVNTAGGLDKTCMGPEATVEQCQPIADRLRQNNTWFVPTLITFLAIGKNKWEKEMTPASHDVHRRLRELSRGFWTDSTGYGNWLRAPDSTADSTATVDSTDYLQVARRAGLPILSGTDADGTKGQLRSKLKGFATHAELAIYVYEGLTPAEALQTATLNPAKMLRGTDSLGTVAVGKLADLVLLDADPLADITNTTAIRPSGPR